MNPYTDFVSTLARLRREGGSWPLGGFAPLPRPAIAPDAPRVLIFSPHPDDEVIIGGLALRLLREAGWRIVNVAVTQGSNRSRQAARLDELKGCCDCIGFDLVQTAPAGLEGITPAARAQDPSRWSAAVGTIASILTAHRPRVILYPHAADWNSTHVGTHLLVEDALRSLPRDFACHTVETEFWAQMPAPNLVVELSEQHLADLITALTFHVGEVRRNPYHLTLPAWMMDNVRRGAEWVGGQGGEAPAFAFATLYRRRRWNGSGFEEATGGGRFLACAANASELFP